MSLMGIALCLCLVLAVVLAVFVWLVRQEAPPPAPAAAPVVVPDPIPPAPVVVAPPPPALKAPAPRLITLRLMSERGRLLGTQRIDARYRRGQMTFSLKGQQQVFVADREVAGSRDWIYRRVAVERAKD